MRYRSKPIEIEAMQFISEADEYHSDNIHRWSGGNFIVVDDTDRVDDPDAAGAVFDKLHNTWTNVYEGQWIIRGTKGEYYPCDDEVFRQKYELMED